MLAVQYLVELVEAREQEVCRLRRELKELRHTVTLRRLLAQIGLNNTQLHT